MFYWVKTRQVNITHTHAHAACKWMSNHSDECGSGTDAGREDVLFVSHCGAVSGLQSWSACPDNNNVHAEHVGRWFLIHPHICTLDDDRVLLSNYASFRGRPCWWLKKQIQIRSLTPRKCANVYWFIRSQYSIHWSVWCWHGVDSSQRGKKRGHLDKNSTLVSFCHNVVIQM